MKIECGVIEDLLPLYLDDVCSQQSKAVVKAHLQECEKCRSLAGADISVDVQVLNCSPNEKAIKKGFGKIRRRWLASIFAVVAAIPLLFLGWNEFSAQGVAYSNLDELRLSDRFMQCLADGDYAKAYSYINVADKKQTWLENWFEEDELTQMEADGLEKFCSLGQMMEQQLGRIESYEYVGVLKSSGTDRDGEPIDQVSYRIRIGGEERIFLVNISGNKVEWFDGGGSYLADPMAKLCMWGEYLWQDYAGCYYDAELKTYVYYEGETSSPKINP